LEDDPVTLHWQWVAPKPGPCVNDRTKEVDKEHAVGGFTEGKRPTIDWSEFDADEIVHKWEVNDDEIVDSIPHEFYDAIIDQLKLIMKAKKQVARNLYSLRPICIAL
ncbi:hypothetical protein CYMTET_22840, partial [Cymbomonas tetramitiformis]